MLLRPRTSGCAVAASFVTECDCCGDSAPDPPNCYGRRWMFGAAGLGPVLAGCWMYPASQMRTVLERYPELSALAPRQLSTAFTATAAEIRVTAFWSGSEKGVQAAVAPYGELGRPSSGSLGGVTFLDLQGRSDDHFCWGRRYYAKGRAGPTGWRWP